MDPITRYDKLIFTDFRKELFGNFYNVGFWNEQTTNQEQASRQLVEHVIASVKSTPQQILDVGCGLGAIANVLKQTWPSADVTGINISQHQIDYATKTFPDCTFQCMDATRLAFESNSFDLIVSIEAANHFNTRLDFLKEAYRVLKPNSKLCMSDLCLRNETRFDNLYIFDVAEFNYIESIPAYEEMLREIGFNDVVVSDMNAQTWQTWVKRTVEYAEKAFRDNAIAEEVYAGWVKNQDYLYESAEYYLYVSATK
jgi:ubiquinone/menaquinone biosynthesis C-methylase UbiE